MQHIDTIGEVGLFGVLVIIAGLIKIPPLEINFWNWLGRIIGKAINGDVIDKVDNLAEELNQLKQSEELQEARGARQRILRFSDEILFGHKHSKEHFDEILEDIDMYERYCEEHTEYENNKAEMAISIIKDVYKDLLHTRGFLVYKNNKA